MKDLIAVIPILMFAGMIFWMLGWDQYGKFKFINSIKRIGFLMCVFGFMAWVVWSVEYFIH